MFKKSIIAVAAIVALGAVTVNSAHAIGLSSAARGSIMKPNSPARSGNVAPIAYQIFCLRNEAQCAAGSVGSVPFNADLMGKLNSVNRSVNSSIVARNESTDVWSLNPSSGDCEDFALTKRAKLLRAGVPAGALRMAVVRTGTGIGHAVLVVKTSVGEYVLDNLRPNIVKRGQTGYRFLQVATQDPRRWVKY